MHLNEGIASRRHGHDVKIWQLFRLSEEWAPRVTNVYEHDIYQPPSSLPPQSGTALSVYNLQYQVTTEQNAVITRALTDSLEDYISYSSPYF